MLYLEYIYICVMMVGRAKMKFLLSICLSCHLSLSLPKTEKYALHPVYDFCISLFQIGCLRECRQQQVCCSDSLWFLEGCTSWKVWRPAVQGRNQKYRSKFHCQWLCTRRRGQVRYAQHAPGQIYGLSACWRYFRVRAHNQEMMFLRVWILNVLS